MLQVSFLLAEEDRKVRLFCPSGHFHVSENGAGITKKPGAVSCFVFLLHYFFISPTWVATANGNYLQNRQEAMQKNDLLDA